MGYVFVSLNLIQLIFNCLSLLGQKPIHYFIRIPPQGQDLKNIYPTKESPNYRIIAWAEMTPFSFVTIFQTLTTCWESYYFRESCIQYLIPRLNCQKRFCVCEHRTCWVFDCWERRRRNSKDSRQDLLMPRLHPNKKTKQRAARSHPGLKLHIWHFLQFES